MLRGVTDWMDFRSLLSLACTCRSIAEDTSSSEFQGAYRHRLLRYAPEIVLSAMSKNIPLMCTSWREALLRVWKLDSLHWAKAQASDKAALAEVPKSRSTYTILVEKGGRRLLRLGGHYFFSVHYIRVEDIVLDSKSFGMVFAPKWERIRPKGIPPSPLRFFSLTSMEWPRSKLVTQPWICMIGGSEISYPYLERNDVCTLVPVVGTSGKTVWRWVRPRIVGEPPRPRRGHSATPVGGRYCRVVIWAGAQASPVMNMNDIHVLDTYIDSSEMHLKDIVQLGDNDVQKSHALTMVWSKVNVAGVPPAGRYGHIHYVREMDGVRGTATIHFFGGAQFSGDLRMYDVNCVRLEGLNSADTSAQWFEKDVAGEGPGKLRGHSVSHVGNSMIIFGGSCADNAAEGTGGDGNQPDLGVTASITIMDLDDLEWRTPTIYGDVPRGRSGHASTLWGTMLVISGGYLPGETVRSTRLSKTDALRLFLGKRDSIADTDTAGAKEENCEAEVEAEEDELGSLARTDGGPTK